VLFRSINYYYTLRELLSTCEMMETETSSELSNRPSVYKKSAPRKTKEINDAVVVLRSAIFTRSGRDKDVTEGIGLLKYLNDIPPI